MKYRAFISSKLLYVIDYQLNNYWHLFWLSCAQKAVHIAALLVSSNAFICHICNSMVQLIEGFMIRKITIPKPVIADKHINNHVTGFNTRDSGLLAQNLDLF